jgi:hypothetical protein
MELGEGHMSAMVATALAWLPCAPPSEHFAEHVACAEVASVGRRFGQLPG